MQKKGDGRGSRCKTCCAAAARDYYARNRAAQQQRARQRKAREYAADPEKFRQRSRDDYASNPEKWAASNRRWVEANRERANKIKRRYYLAHPEVTREAVRRRRARKRNNGVERYSERDIFERDGGRCFHCRAELTLEPRSGWNIDHIVPIALGGPDTAANVQLSCPTCNKKKSTRLEGQIHFGV